MLLSYLSFSMFYCSTAGISGGTSAIRATISGKSAAILHSAEPACQTGVFTVKFFAIISRAISVPLYGPSVVQEEVPTEV